MELHFLGTSSGTPTRSRNVSGLAVKRRQSRDWYLVDCGEGTQHQLLRTPLSLQTLRAIFITTCTATTAMACPACWPVPPCTAAPSRCGWWHREPSRPTCAR